MPMESPKEQGKLSLARRCRLLLEPWWVTLAIFIALLPGGLAISLRNYDLGLLGILRHLVLYGVLAVGLRMMMRQVGIMVVSSPIAFLYRRLLGLPRRQGLFRAFFTCFGIMLLLSLLLIPLLLPDGEPLSARIFQDMTLYPMNAPSR